MSAASECEEDKVLSYFWISKISAKHNSGGWDESGSFLFPNKDTLFTEQVF